MWVAALIAAAASIGSAVIAARAQSASEEEAKRLLDQARNEFGELDLPSLEQLAGDELPPTELAKIKTDARYKQAQLASLDKLTEMGEGGLTLQDEATMAAAMGKASRAEGAGRSAIQQGMAARGTLGSGAELAMSLDNQQDSAQRSHAAGMDAAANAQARAYDAILKRGSIAGQMEDREYGQKSKAAQAQDLINHYNGTRKKDAVQQDFNNRLAIVKGKNGVTGDLVESARNTGNNTARAAGAAGNAINQGATAIGSYAESGNDYLSSPQGLSAEDEESYLARARRGGN